MIVSVGACRLGRRAAGGTASEEKRKGKFALHLGLLEDSKRRDDEMVSPRRYYWIGTLWVGVVALYVDRRAIACFALYQSKRCSVSQQDAEKDSRHHIGSRQAA
jgi:hypothetical protein